MVVIDGIVILKDKTFRLILKRRRVRPADFGQVVGTEVVYRTSNASPPILSHPVTALSQCHKVQNLPEHCSQNAVLSVVVSSVLITAVVAVLVTAAEAFSEVVVVRTLVFAIAVISVVRVLVGIGI